MFVGVNMDLVMIKVLTCPNVDLNVLDMSVTTLAFHDSLRGIL